MSIKNRAKNKSLNDIVNRLKISFFNLEKKDSERLLIELCDSWENMTSFNFWTNINTNLLSNDRYARWALGIYVEKSFFVDSSLKNIELSKIGENKNGKCLDFSKILSNPIDDRLQKLIESNFSFKRHKGFSSTVDNKAP